MEKSTESNSKELNIADITTYQAGVIQSTAFRAINKVTAAQRDSEPLQRPANRTNGRV